MMPIRKPRAEPIEAAPRPTTPEGGAPPIERSIPAGVDELMISSLPAMASGADVYLRQFYRGSQLPWRRYLPLKGL